APHHVHSLPDLRRYLKISRM
ncbi:DUF6893 family small protein, partial [Streptomyces sp. NPDC058964]